MGTYKILENIIRKIQDSAYIWEDINGASSVGFTS